MSFWTAIVVIVAIGCLTKVLRTKYRARSHEPASDTAGLRSDPALENEVEQLRERIKVLERIATEDRETRRLSAEIESLREK
ncbi:MAG TPA: hypothetical protein VNR60_10080 [Croceibacterium sp.]|nr:hypothetical protein [Croceibacterium sp.]